MKFFSWIIKKQAACFLWFIWVFRLYSLHRWLRPRHHFSSVFAVLFVLSFFVASLPGSGLQSWLGDCARPLRRSVVLRMVTW